ncbi:MAG TPA: amidohydrolase family protein [Thermoanaerobaculia bacterium]|nr:amidohydrolase family protein [Thermoanaerobaculia bacterium]
MSLLILVTLIWRGLLAPTLFGRRGGFVASRLGTDPPAAILSAAAGALLLGALTLSASADAQQAGARGGPPLLLRDAVVIDGRGGAAAPANSVIVAEGVIAAIGPARELEARYPSAEARDLHGRFLVPGFVDAHAHVTLGPVEVSVEGGEPAVRVLGDPQVAPRSLRTLLAHGVTSARDPGGATAETVRVRDAVASGELLGPRLVVAGAVIDRTPFEGLTTRVESAEEVRAEVRRQAAAGVDLIKLYAWLEPELIRAGVEEARAHALPAVAHLMHTTWTEGAELGLHSVLHIVPGSPELLPEAERAAYREEMKTTAFFATWFERADLDGSEMRAAIAALARNRTFLDPTLVAFEPAFFGDRPEQTTARLGLELATPSLAASWPGFRFDLGWNPQTYRRAQDAWPKVLELTRRLHRAGVRLTAGTDANNPWTVPGPSFHRELELLAEAGIPLADVLTIATRNGAEALGLLAETGTIEEGKRADLVALRKNPLERPGATRSIEWVMKDGVLHRPQELLEGLVAKRLPGPGQP